MAYVLPTAGALATFDRQFAGACLYYSDFGGRIFAHVLAAPLSSQTPAVVVTFDESNGHTLQLFVSLAAARTSLGHRAAVELPRSHWDQLDRLMVAVACGEVVTRGPACVEALRSRAPLTSPFALMSILSPQ